MAHRRQIPCCIGRLDGDNSHDNRAIRELFGILQISYLSSDNENELCTVFLFGHSAITPLTVCDTQNYFYHHQRKQQILVTVYGSSPGRHRPLHYANHNANVRHNKEYPGCTVCLITLEFGAQKISKLIKIRPDF